jgi:hypothetical protein
MSNFGKMALSVAGIATLMAAAMPVSAANMNAPVSVSGHNDIAMEQAADGHRRRWRRHDNVDGGDILAGIGILAGIAIIAGAASDADRSDRRRNDGPVYRNDAPERYDDRSSNSAGNDVGSAVSACSDAAERSAGNGARVREIGSVTREGNGWRVDGSLDGRDNDRFTCTATNGRVDDVRINGRI